MPKGRPVGRVWERVFGQLDRIEWKLDRLMRGARTMADDFSAMEAAIAEQTTVAKSVETLLDELVQMIDDLKVGASPSQQAKIDELTAGITANTEVLKAAVVQGTEALGLQVNPL